MANNKIEFKVLVSGIDEFKKSVGGISEGLDNVSRITKNVARDLSQLGGIVSLLGASMSGPLILAFKNSAKSSAEVSTQLKRMENTASQFQKELASAVVPVFEKFNNVLGNLLKTFQSIG